MSSVFTHLTTMSGPLSSLFIRLFLTLCGIVTTASALALRPPVTLLSKVRLSAASDYDKLEGEKRVNLKIDLDSAKVASMETLDFGEKKAYCRCWLSGTFPLCDGSHLKHNVAMNDNVGPLIISVPAAEIKDVDKTVEGRKKRVLIGYYATSITYLVYAARYLAISGAQSFPVQVASGYVLAAGIACILASAVRGGRLSSDTYKRLNLSLLGYGLLGGVGWGLVQLSHTRAEFVSPLLLAPFFATVNAIKGYTYGVLGINKAGKASILGDFKHGVTTTAKGYLAVPKNAKAAGYLGATWMLTIMKLAKLVETVRLIHGGASGLIVYSRVSRFARYTIMASVMYTLKDAADRDRLDGTTFIELNFLSSVVLAALASYLGIFTPLGGAAALFSVFSAFNGVTALVKKRQS
jgi:CDGSH-type Zn-finger protein